MNPLIANPICLERSGGFICSLDAGHSGNHRADGYAEWPQDEPKFVVSCAWCEPGKKFDVPVTHGICPRHYAEMIASIPERGVA